MKNRTIYRNFVVEHRKYENLQKVLFVPETEQLQPLPMDQVDPGPCQMAKLVDHSLPVLLSKGEDWRLRGGVQQEGQEGLWLRPGVLLEDRVKDRM